MAQHYKNESITKSRVKVFLGWENFNPKGCVAPGRMDQNLCGRLWTQNNRSAISLAVAPIKKALEKPTTKYLESLPYTPTSIGEKFGPSFANHVFRLDITIPESFDNEPVHLIWDSNSEAMVLSENAVPRQGLVGGDHWARRADYPLFPDRKDSIAQKGETLRLYIEIACNGLFGAGRGGDIEPPDMDKYYALEECCLSVFDPTAWALIHDVTLLSRLVDHLPETPQRARALQVANEVVNVVDVSDPSTYHAGRKLASKFLACHNGSSQSVVHTMLHSHIDLAWLWPMASTPAKGARTFATHLRLMELYPECVYVQSQAQLYEWVKQGYPNLWDELCQRVREGRFVPTGATWVEMDCNLPCGESLIRQFVLGQDFFESNFGIRCNEFWLPDTFGYCGQLPQIMKACGVDNFLTIKLSWNLFNKFPHSTFVWEGLDGSRVLAHMPPADTYNAQAFPEEVLRSANKNKDSSVINQSVMLVGHGDGGGGASPAMMESMRRMHDLDGVPKVQFSTPAKFFKEVYKERNNLPRWVGELYFELHRGTFTSQAVTKKSNRKCETLLRDLEAISSQALLLGSCIGMPFTYPSDLLKECWKLVLKNCFHDTLPGSCIAEVYNETARDYAYVTEKCIDAINTAVTFICRYLMKGDEESAQPAKRAKIENGRVSAGAIMNGESSDEQKLVLVVRSSASEMSDRPYILETDQPSPSAGTGDVFKQNTRIGAMPCLPIPKKQGESQERSLVAIKVRPTGIGFLSNVQMISSEDIDRAITPATIVAHEVEGGEEYLLANGFLEARVSSTGRLMSLVLISPSGHRREALSQSPSPGEPDSNGGNRLVIYDDLAQFWDAWDTEVYCFEKKVHVGQAIFCKIIEDGPLRVGLHVKYPATKAKSTIEQFIMLRAESTRLDFRTTVDWKESRKILRVLFDTNVRASHASYDSQFGFVQRPTTFNHSWEIAKFESVGHHYCDLSEHKFGVAILNDCKYGYSVRDSTMRLSLLRAPKSPDDQADMGVHTMTYSILPHWDSFPTKVVIQEGEDLNWPPLLHDFEVPGLESAALKTTNCTFQVLSNPGNGLLDSVIISAVKQADKHPGNIVIRLYEAMGARGTARVKCPSCMQVKSVQECNMLEDVLDGDSEISACLSDPEHVEDGTSLSISFTPFQIRTVMLQFE